ncbi:hypothetical protein GO755_26560 [Spirosoma sp. HMF4905]|uniref:Uncharacterized protein n=1 Tax=Spirosoma arboris TaxID=2682092 RepID=A0A7K1SIH9_9BACT|nr:hypothetical protein [Spirosoma arboris]MVM33629.1 hypothetical protein [Spirosoma arboris]
MFILLSTFLKVAIPLVSLAMLLVGYLLYRTLSTVKLDAEQKRLYGLTPIEFPEQHTRVAKDQPEYRPLPAHFKEGDQGQMVACWQLAPLDRLKILLTGKLWCSMWTFHKPVQPLFFSVNKADVLEPTT